MPPEIFFIAPRPGRFVSGGNIYNRQLIGALRGAGYRVRLSEPASLASAKLPPGSLVVVDSIFLQALLEGGFELPTQVKWAALIHYLPEFEIQGLDPDPRWISLFDFMLFPSPFMRQRFLAVYPGQKGPSFILPPILNIPFWPPLAIKIPETPTMVIAGNYLPVKGIFPFLEALDKGLKAVPVPPAFSLKVFGSKIDQQYWEACAGLVQNSPELRGRVHLNGPIPQRRLWAEYSESTLMVSASGFESFGLAVAEALQLGLPVFALNRGNLPFLHSHGGTLRLFDEISDLSEAILGGILQPELLQTCRIKAMASPFDCRPYQAEQVVRTWEWIMDHFW